MKKRWNIIGRMTVCTLAAAMMVMIGSQFKMTARAEMVLDGEEAIQAVSEEETQAAYEEELQAVSEEIIPASDDMDAFQADIPAETEAGAIGIDVMQIVTIEEEMVPGAALPDLEAVSPEEEAEAEAQEEDLTEETEAAEEPAAEEAAPETSVSETITYEDDEVVVTVIASEAAQLPANTEVKVAKLAEGSEKYEAAKEAARQSLAASEDASYTFYDVTLESEGQALEIEEGTVSVRMELKETQEAKKQVVSIKETESGKVARDVTDAPEYSF